MAGPRFPVATVRIDALEVARGHDGLLRGMPEPLALVAVFGCGPGHARLLDRRAVRFRRPSDLPCTLAPRESVVMAPMLAEDDTGALILTIGVEVDGGEAVSRLYGALERAERFAGWIAGEVVPEPVLLAGLGDRARTRAEPVELLLDGEDLVRLRGDDVIGAAVTYLEGDRRSTRDARFGLVSPDQRNDWTLRARVGLRVRPGGHRIQGH